MLPALHYGVAIKSCNCDVTTTNPSHLSVCKALVKVLGGALFTSAKAHAKTCVQWKPFYGSYNVCLVCAGHLHCNAIFSLGLTSLKVNKSFLIQHFTQQYCAKLLCFLLYKNAGLLQFYTMQLCNVNRAHAEYRNSFHNVLPLSLC